MQYLTQESSDNFHTLPNELMISTTCCDPNRNAARPLLSNSGSPFAVLSSGVRESFCPLWPPSAPRASEYPRGGTSHRPPSQGPCTFAVAPGWSRSGVFFSKNHLQCSTSSLIHWQQITTCQTSYQVVIQPPRCPRSKRSDDETEPHGRTRPSLRTESRT